MAGKRATTTLAVMAFAVPALAASNAMAVNYNINWLNMSPTGFGSPVPNNSNFTLPGVGNVNVTYSIPNAITHQRQPNATLQNGNVTAGPDNYAWGAHELFGATNLAPNPPFVPTFWSITYTFSGAIPANTLYLGAAGLGSTTSFGGGSSFVRVLQNGTFLGDWSGGNNWGPTLFTPSAGSFTMQNSLSSPGGADPWWNSQLGVVQINDTVSSLTVFVDQLPGDGLGINIGSVIPSPGAASLLTLGGIVALRRRR